MKTILVLFAFIFIHSSAAVFPNFFEKCNRKDKDFHECCKKASAAGLAYLTKAIPEYHLPNLNPLEIPEIPLTVDPAGVVSTSPNLKNCKIFGLNEMTMRRFEFLFEQKKFMMDAQVPNWRQECEYNMKGTILGVPIDGRGLSIFILKNYKFDLEVDWEEYKVEDKTHMKLIFKRSRKEPETFLLTFEGQDAINKAIAADPHLVFESIRESFENFVGFMIQEGATGFYATVSMEEAFD